MVADAFHGIQDKAMLQEEFHGAIPDCAAHLQVLKLRDNGLGDDELQGLGEALQENSLLQDLDLAGNQVCLLVLCCVVCVQSHRERTQRHNTIKHQCKSLCVQQQLENAELQHDMSVFFGCFWI